MKISLIVATGLKNEIGQKNQLPWKHIKADLKHFKEITNGHCIIMGRKCFESIGKALPNRTNIVVSSNPGYKADGCIVKDTLQLAMDYAVSRNESEVFIIGGGTLYKQMLSTKSVNKIYLTEVNGEFSEADVFFPELNPNEWIKEEIGSAEKNEDNDYSVKFYILKNKRFL